MFCSSAGFTAILLKYGLGRWWSLHVVCGKFGSSMWWLTVIEEFICVILAENESYFFLLLFKESNAGVSQVWLSGRRLWRWPDDRTFAQQAEPLLPGHHGARYDAQPTSIFFFFCDVRFSYLHTIFISFKLPMEDQKWTGMKIVCIIFLSYLSVFSCLLHAIKLYKRLRFSCYLKIPLLLIVKACVCFKKSVVLLSTFWYALIVKRMMYWCTVTRYAYLYFC